jgi:hypothetical protein
MITRLPIKGVLTVHGAARLTADGGAAIERPSRRRESMKALAQAARRVFCRRVVTRAP